MQKTVMAKKRVDWIEVAALVDTIVSEINNEVFYYDLVIAITRGGLVPATMLSHKLRITNFVSVDPHNPYVIPGWCLNGTSPLIVDDIYDTGETLASLDYIHTAGTRISGVAVLHNRKYKGFKKDKLPKIVNLYEGEVIKNSAHIVYPWETYATSVKG